jgi:hypothetical protein
VDVATRRVTNPDPELDEDGGAVMHVHVMEGDSPDDAEKADNGAPVGEVLHHLCGKHYRELRDKGKLEGMSVRRDDDCGGRCDNCPRPKAL